MSKFRVPIETVHVKPHPKADSLDIATVQGFEAVVKRGDFTTGDLVAYIPEGAVVPDALIKEMGLEGRLAGSKKNRVKAIRLRETVSQGLIYPARRGWVLGQDVQLELGITKYEPPPPRSMGGPNVPRDPNALSPHTWRAGGNRTIFYDIENYKAHARREPRVIPDGMFVTFSEKLHGTWTQFAVMPPAYKHYEYGDFIVSSKGLVARNGVAYKLDHPDAQSTFYVRVANALGMEQRIKAAFVEELKTQQVFVLGEIIGEGVQDLAYTPDPSFGVPDPEHKPELMFRVFDIFIGTPPTPPPVIRGDLAPPEPPPKNAQEGRYLNHVELEAACRRLGLSRVPVLYGGPFSEEMLQLYTDGLEMVSGEAIHIREGVIIRPLVEPTHPEIGRVILKSVSQDYLLRKGDTTEFQ